MAGQGKQVVGTDRRASPRERAAPHGANLVDRDRAVKEDAQEDALERRGGIA